MRWAARRPMSAAYFRFARIPRRINSCAGRLPGSTSAVAAPAGTVLVIEERSGEAFSLPASPNDRLNYGWSVLTCLASAMSGPGAAGTGTVLRRGTLESYARRAGFSSIEDAGVPHEAWTFWRMRS